MQDKREHIEHELHDAKANDDEDHEKIQHLTIKCTKLSVEVKHHEEKIENLEKELEHEKHEHEQADD